MDKILTILSIDDDEAIRFALKAVIESQGWVAITAENVAVGLECYKEFKPDLILMDYHMPRINGFEGVRMIRTLDAHIPIIVFTIDESQELADRFLEVGATDFAMKPIRTPDIISRIKLHIKLIQTRETTNTKPKVELVPAKGIGMATLELILDALVQIDDFIAVEEISEISGLAYQTTYRYLQYLSAENIVEVKSTYGKVGRPKQTYKLIQ
ncbi:response regulator [Fusibacter sp. 3D3]|uniref:response regulator n=1 Tax=Fusibacter sp. 3D3 TaxID=1048380 RepID=UPI000857D985|nr:response regulator [Fusibacter sp. 3D3]GAU76121.1 response regulator [Fusibacter sp. 3D3]